MMVELEVIKPATVMDRHRIIKLSVSALADDDDDVRSTAATAVEAIVVASRNRAHLSLIDTETMRLLILSARPCCVMTLHVRG